MVEITGNKSGLDTAIKSVNSSLAGLKQMIIGAFSVEAIKSFVSSEFDLAAGLVKSARQLGTTVEQVQILKRAAEESGTEFNALETAIGKVAIARQKALGGSKEDIKKFTDLGISTSDIKAKSSSDLLFKNIGDAVKNAKGLDNIAAPISNILGRGFEEIMPVLKTNVDEVGESMRRAGEIMDTRTAVSLKVLGDSFKELGLILMVQLAPAVMELTKTLIEVASKGAGRTAQIGAELGEFYAQLENRAQNFGGAIGPAGPSINWGAINMAGNVAKKPFDIDFMEIQKAIDRITKELTNPTGEGTKTVPAYKEHAKSVKDYSDSLTASGNMFGASFRGMGGVATQLDIQKNQLSALEQMKQYNQRQITFLETIAKNTVNNSNNSWWQYFR